MSESSQVPGGHATGGPASRRSRGGSRAPAAVAGCVAALITLVATVLSAPAAWAHDELLDLQPGNKVVLSTPPTQVQLVFGAPALQVGSQIRVTGPGGRVVSTGPLAINGGTVVEKLVTGLTDGQYRVDWRVTSSDGHPVSGTYTFSIKAAAPTAAASPSVTATGPTAPASGPASPTPTPTATSTATSTATAAAAGGGSGSSGSGPSAGLVAGLTAVVALVAAAAFTVVRRRTAGATSRTEGNPHQ